MQRVVAVNLFRKARGPVRGGGGGTWVNNFATHYHATQAMFTRKYNSYTGDSIQQ